MIIRGQISTSITSPKAGRNARKKRRKARPVSNGTQTARIRPAAMSAAKARSASARPAGVKCVVTTRSPRSRSARIRGAADRISPRLTAWTQTAPGSGLL